MLPLQQAIEVKQSIIEYIKATFHFKEKSVHDAFYQFIGNEKNGIIKGPYLSLKTPFMKSATNEEIPLEIKPSFPPYQHQAEAFFRLSCRKGNTPQPTLLTTGTGSGKTECFLYPILDYCYKNMHRKGIKVIILYPMNALATDQAKRLAEIIYKDHRLQGKVTAGLFIGEGKDADKHPVSMEADHIIEDRDTIVNDVPDILLTNFKMLDYGLMKANYNRLWQHNRIDTTLLQYLVLDELHTYDGAQGTDVANLIRRLKLKLSLPQNQLCPVGTSATIGTGADSAKLLCDYASTIFGEQFDLSAVISEHRMEVDKYFPQEPAKFMPTLSAIQHLKMRNDETYNQYMDRQKSLWQLYCDTDEELAKELLNLEFVKQIASIINNRYINITHLITKLAAQNREYRQLPEEHKGGNPRLIVLESILSLISKAKTDEGMKSPFMYLQVQLWLRELSGILRQMNTSPVFTWRNDLSKEEDKATALPAYFCRECGASGWIATKNENDEYFHPDAKEASAGYFENSKNIYLLNTNLPEHAPIEEYDPTDKLLIHVMKRGLQFSQKENEDTVPLIALRKVVENKSRFICPECGTENTISIIGQKVATLASVAISQLMASNLDASLLKERKILAFTNSVQDAAHQAGFFESRNYRFTFRTSLQRVIQLQESPISLKELQTRFLIYWKHEYPQIEEFVYRFFPTDYRGKIDLATDYKKSNGQYTDNFLQELDHRLAWEIISEFGYNAQIGRTLEKTGSSATFFNKGQIAKVCRSMEPWLQENQLTAIGNEELERFVNGLLHRIRIRGAVDHCYLNQFRNSNLSSGHSLYDLNMNQKGARYFLNRKFGKRARFPKMITPQAHRAGVLDTTNARKENWYHTYFAKTFPLALDDAYRRNDFYTQLFEELTQAGILSAKAEGGTLNYAILPEAIWVSKKAKHIKCNHCQSTLCVGEEDILSKGCNCLDYKCQGYYIEEKDSELNYYQQVYNRNLSPRIYAAEHTGLLERSKREELEIAFKEHPKFNSCNTLVATSTLEMGIDIGNLNMALNTSIPPQPANFIQRVGRAGRKSGSALIVNFAQSKPHDMYYFTEPLDMMEGNIHTPGCFLAAKDILRRHFLAFCFDSWTAADATEHRIPQKIKYLRLANNFITSKGFFINQLIDYIRTHAQTLYPLFATQYPAEIADSLNTLYDECKSESLFERIRREFGTLQNNYKKLGEKSAEINVAIEAEHLQPSDEEYKTYREQQMMIRGLMKRIRENQVLEFMTNAGLLPNYAFPETGITLNASILSRPPEGSDASAIGNVSTIEVVRSARQAIREMAPSNYFYCQGYRLKIDGINPYDREEVLTMRRFCSQCDAIGSDTSNETQCPKCGDRSWGAASNVHKFLRLRSVKSSMKREEAMLDDRSDDREQMLYQLTRHFTFEKEGFAGAYGMKEIPFGIEYTKHVTVTEVNLGTTMVRNARHIDINGVQQVPVHGFVTCRHCGKSTPAIDYVTHQSSQEKALKDLHYPYCKHKDTMYNQQEDENFEELFLFHEIQTEAIKVLLPVQEIEQEAIVSMFKAGISLGLCDYYQGNPQHIQMEEYREFNEANGKFDKYLVMYDTIPGGTGYLAKLFDTKEFSRLMELSYDRIRNCECQYHGKDGCYHCILTYGNQYTHEQLSRERAEQLFGKITEASKEWRPVENGLGVMTGNGILEDSELEERFMQTLKRTAYQKGWTLQMNMNDAIRNYSLVITEGRYRYGYRIYNQVDLGVAQNIKYHTRSDFQFICTSIQEETIEGWKECDAAQVKQMAIFLDGYTYHASAEHNRFGGDFLKRQAIKDSGNMYSWTLTWDDLDRFESKDPALQSDSMAIDRKQYKDTIEALEEFYENQPCWMRTLNNMERLTYWLSHPLEQQQIALDTAQYLSGWNEELSENVISGSAIHQVIETGVPVAPSAEEEENGPFYFSASPFVNTSWASIRLFVNAQSREVQYKLLVLEKVFENLDKQSWNHFWQMWNLLQLCKSNTVQTKEAIREKTPTLDELKEVYYEEELWPVLQMLLEANIRFNYEGGFELEDEEGVVHGCASLGFREKRIVLLPEDNTSTTTFIQAGYTIVEPQKFTIDLLQ